MIRFKYLTTKDLDMVNSIVGYNPHMEKILSSLGFKICVLSDNKPIFILICVYGTKHNHAYLAELWRDNSPLSMRVLGHVKKHFDNIHKDWTIVFNSTNVHKYSRHTKKYNDKLYQYIGSPN